MKDSRTTQAGLLVVVGILIALAGWRWLRSSTTHPGAATPASAVPHLGAPRVPPASRKAPMLGSIAGKVADPSGAPLPAAQVCATAASSPVSPEHGDPTCATTSTDGRYQLVGLPPGRLTLVASAPNHRPTIHTAPDGSRFLQLGGGEERIGVDFTLGVGGVRVNGRVKDVGGGAIAGALVVLDDDWPGTRGGAVVTRSDDAGVFSAWIDEGRYTARATADGYAEGRKDGMAPGAAIELLLTPGAVLVGRVIEAGAPVAGATVSPGTDQGWGPSAGSSVVTGDDGRFRVTGLQPGRYKPTARAPTGFGQARESVLLGVAQTSREVTIELHPACRIAGRVVVAPGNDPCTNGAVVLVDGVAGQMIHASIDSDGSARFEGVPRGSYQVIVNCQDHAAERSYPPVPVVGSADIEGLLWTVRVGLSLGGRVVDTDGKPVHASVHAAPVGGGFGPPTAVAQNDDNGRFVLRGLRPGKLRLVANARDHVPPDPVEVDLVDAQAPDVTIVVNAGGSVEGRVMDEEDHPIADAAIMIVGQVPQFRPPLSSLEDGTFSLKGLGPGEYRVWATRGDADGSGTAAGAGSQVSVAVKAGATARVQLVLARQRGEIHGRVVDDVGEPVTDAFVDASRESAGPGSVARSPWARPRTPVLTDPSGGFAIENLGDGAYAVHAFRKGGGSASLEHVKVGSNVTLTIQTTGALSGTVELPGGGRAEQFSIQVVSEASRLFRSESFLHSGGVWTMSELPEGKYRISAVAAEGTATAELTLARGERRNDVALSLAARGTIRGQVVSLADRAPLGGVSVRVFARHGMVGATAGQENVVTDAEGHFEIGGAPSGAVMLIAMPSDPMTSENDAALVPIEVSPGRGNDVGQILMARRRVKRGEVAGDLGYTCQPPVSMDFASSPNIVDTVRPEGPAAAAELRVGDVIVGVDGYDVSGKMGYLYRSLTNVVEGTEVTLGLARGTSVTIVAGKQWVSAQGSAFPSSVPARAPPSL